ncbi:MAG: hypothetical protein JXA81_10850 [Sedimentisphaerales bacterium]|nr:hypothetical protein [Sedimentisphaerales bacterium]
MNNNTTTNKNNPFTQTEELLKCMEKGGTGLLLGILGALYKFLPPIGAIIIFIFIADKGLVQWRPYAFSAPLFAVSIGSAMYRRKLIRTICGQLLGPKLDVVLPEIRAGLLHPKPEFRLTALNSLMSFFDRDIQKRFEPEILTCNQDKDLKVRKAACKLARGLRKSSGTT